MRRIERRMNVLLPRVVRRVTNGEPTQPGWLPRRWLTVVSSDLDLDAGIGAVWVVWRPGSAGAEAYTGLFERCGREWRSTGGGAGSSAGLPAERRAVGRSGQVGMIEFGGGMGGLSRADSLRRHRPELGETSHWVGADEIHVAAEVDHLLLGERRIDVPPHGALIVAWRSPSTSQGGTRPLIVAVGRDGAELSRIGPHDSMDSYTWAQLSGE
ncbi:hypothetical protein SAMN05216223_12583 [Actinacidiphila yanglinensis]|uniref:Uncharacterized protein n=2 Tax=Actinacidiphila yanglinensis TaxID=310779 RepID=A0A1H6E5G2_9ACTN|nr:hypothetical protein SAMN05216223_12583 [Actinacidiphila yanglinensis]